MKLFSAHGLARVTLSVAIVATAFPMPHPDEFSQLFAACLETRDPSSDECVRAQEASGLSPDEFVAKLMRKLEPQPEPRPDLWSFMKDCAVTRDVAGDACRRFFHGSALTSDEIARLAEKLAPQKIEPQGGDTAGTTDVTKTCLAMRASVNGMSAQDLMAMAEKVNAVCAKALAESGLSPADFWRKYGRR